MTTGPECPRCGRDRSKREPHQPGCDWLDQQTSGSWTLAEVGVTPHNSPVPSEATDLKTCPFCGGEPGVVCNGPSVRQMETARAWGEDYDVSYYIQCCGCAAISTECGDRADAINAWNRRSETSV